MKSPFLSPTKISCVFYREAAERPWRTRLYQFISWQKIAHCSVIFEQEDKKFIYVINPRGGMYLVDYEKYLWIIKQQQLAIDTQKVELGISPVSLVQISSFVDRPKFKLSPFYENIFWWVIGRHLSKTYQPMTCALAVSYLLRFCGYTVDLHVAPHKLYKELQDGVDNHFWTGSGGKDSLSPSDS